VLFWKGKECKSREGCGHVTGADMSAALHMAMDVLRDLGCKSSGQLG
jgi:hypothetical protein